MRNNLRIEQVLLEIQMKLSKVMIDWFQRLPGVLNVTRRISDKTPHINNVPVMKRINDNTFSFLIRHGGFVL
jgi:hypothetical protein